MVKRYSDDGKSFWHEPPFTPEEEAELEGLWLPPVQVSRQRPVKEEPKK
jgi:hypothetical protein